MGKYIFIRHGESNINVLGVLSGDSDVSGLTEKGMAQARRTAEQLSGIKIDGIISSPLKRAFETAKIIGEVLNIDVKTDERLIEVNLGRAKEKKINEFT
ncbi:histidine phosphatase family protein, partial [Acidiplasma sp.]